MATENGYIAQGRTDCGRVKEGRRADLQVVDLHTVRMTLGELEGQLDDRFYRAGRSVVVNLTQISRVSKKEIILRDGTPIPLPRGAYEGVNRAIIGLR